MVGAAADEQVISPEGLDDVVTIILKDGDGETGTPSGRAFHERPPLAGVGLQQFNVAEPFHVFT